MQVRGSKGLGYHADPYTSIHSAGVAPEKAHPGQTSPKVQNRGISGPTKRTYVLQKLKSNYIKRHAATRCSTLLLITCLIGSWMLLSPMYVVRRGGNVFTGISLSVHRGKGVQYHPTYPR